MVLLLDTDTIPEGDRVEALNAAFSSSESPQIVTFDTSAPVRHRMDLFQMGPGGHLSGAVAPTYGGAGLTTA